MSQLIIVSNRVPASIARQSNGGLTVALGQTLADFGGGTWVGWSGSVSSTPARHQTRQGSITYRTLDFNPSEYQNFYMGFCNSTLWPLCHYRMDLCQYTPAMYEGYESVNQRFAQEINTIAKPDDLIWVHDYHLFSLASHMRARHMLQSMGFFMHIPFPVPEIFVALPHYQKILENLTAYDLVGFQTTADLQAFVRCLKELLQVQSIEKIGDGLYDIHTFGRRFRAGKFSISIDPAELVHAAEESKLDPETQKLKKSLGERQMIIGVDRLDYSKGLTEKLNGFEWFLDHYPQYKGNVSYIQITPPTRSDVRNYAAIRRKLENRVASINGKNAEINWTPLQYINRSFKRSQLAGFYRLSRVGFVAPLRDGMNLVAKEFVASQDATNPGVLVLSKFAGVAEQFACGALLLNPYNAGEAADYLHMALSMPLNERIRRYESMMEVLERETMSHWRRNFLDCLKAARATPIHTMPIVKDLQPKRDLTLAKPLARKSTTRKTLTLPTVHRLPPRIYN